jgi:general secretion pathway protein M
LTLSGVTGDALRSWLGEARSAARARPIDAQLQRGAEGYTGSIVVGLGVGP